MPEEREIQPIQPLGAGNLTGFQGAIPSKISGANPAQEASDVGVTRDVLDEGLQNVLGQLNAEKEPKDPEEAKRRKEIEALMLQLQEALAKNDIATAEALLSQIQALAGNIYSKSDLPDFATSIPNFSPITGSYAPGSAGSSQGSAPAGVIEGPIEPFNGKTVSPIDNYRVTSEFGNRPSMGDYHTGIDLAAPTGTPIKAAADGTITRVANDPKGYGNWVEVKHADGSYTRYGHMSAFGNIKVGQQVGAGSVIGAVGSTGRSTGPHLHFEWRDANHRAFNPRQRMNFG